MGGYAGGVRGCLAALILAGLSQLSCGQFWHDGGSVSYGYTNGGTIIEPVALPVSGDGYWKPPIWEQRGLHYGTAELVGLVRHLGRELSAEMPGHRLAVADLSFARGGPSAWHRSHQTGRDIDLIYYQTDAQGRPIDATSMRHFGADGVSTERDLPTVHFDDAANWRLIKALVENPIADVQWIFAHEALEDRMLEHARKIGEPPGLILAAAVLLHQPTNVQNHDDHMHIRLLCDPGDVDLGCRETGPWRWHRTDYKYRQAERIDRLAPILRATAPGMRALSRATPSAMALRGFVLR